MADPAEIARGLEDDNGRCPECGEDEMDGGRCYYCGYHDYDCGVCDKCVAEPLQGETP